MRGADMVIRDLMDVMRPHGEYTATATFYETRPLNNNAGGTMFDFAYVEPRTKQYTRIFANVAGEDDSIAIRTNERLPFKAGECYVRMPDGRLYICEQVMLDYDKASKQALRMFAMPVGTEKLLRLSVYNDGWRT